MLALLRSYTKTVACSKMTHRVHSMFSVIAVTINLKNKFWQLLRQLLQLLLRTVLKNMPLQVGKKI